MKKVWCVKAVSNKTLFGSERLHRSNDRDYVVAKQKELARGNPYWTYTVIRLVTRRERLRRKLLTESAAFDAKAGFVGQDQERAWNAGYARALRDVAGQL